MNLEVAYQYIFGHSGLPVAVKLLFILIALLVVFLLYASFSYYNYRLAKMYGFADWLLRLAWIPILNLATSTYIFAYAISKVFDTRLKETIVFAAFTNFFIILNFKKLTFLSDGGILGLIASVISIFVYTTFYLYYSKSAYLGLFYSVLGLIPALNLILPLIVSLTTIKHTDGYGHWEDLFTNLKGEDSEAVLLERAEKRLKENLAQSTKIGNESDLEYKVDSKALENIREQKRREEGGGERNEREKGKNFGVGSLDVHREVSSEETPTENYDFFLEDGENYERNEYSKQHKVDTANFLDGDELEENLYSNSDIITSEKAEETLKEKGLSEFITHEESSENKDTLETNNFSGEAPKEGEMANEINRVAVDKSSENFETFKETVFNETYDFQIEKDTENSLLETEKEDALFLVTEELEKLKQIDSTVFYKKMGDEEDQEDTSEKLKQIDDVLSSYS